MQENALRFLTVAGFMVFLSSCAFVEDFTKDSTETLGNTSDVSTDATSSTSHRDKDKDKDKKQSNEQKIKTFAAVNIDRLKEDMARGSGEHLTAFAQLLGIKEPHQTDFFAFTKQNYPVLFSPEPTTSEDMLARLYTGLNAYPAWRQ